jgi:extradiol dioxygenase family protein
LPPERADRRADVEDPGVLTAAAAVAFIPSTDLDRGRRFYEDTLGLPVAEASDHGVVLDLQGTSAASSSSATTTSR